MHVADRQKLMEEYRKQNLLLFQQWETDLEKTRENEEKLQVVTAVDLIKCDINNYSAELLPFSALTLLVG